MEASAIPAGCEPRCPACAHRGWERSASEVQKQAWLREMLAPWADRIESVRGAEVQERLGYRDKTCLRAEWAGDRWKFGMVIARARPKGRKPETELVEIPDCPVHSARVRRILAELSRALPGPPSFPLVYVMISGSLATLVVKASECVDPGPVRVPGLTGIFLNLNPAAGKRVTSSRGWRKLWGEEHAKDSEGLAYGPGSFRQLIPRLYFEALVEARDFLRPEPGDRVLDLCSGTGASLRIWRERGAEALGVELSGEAVRFAEMNLGAGAVLRGRVADRLPQLEAWLKNHGTGSVLLFGNPPRTGLGEDVIRWLGETARPSRIAYLACSAGTLARELSILVQAGYGVRRIIPYDFFPQTYHVETLALLDLDSRARVPGLLGEWMPARPIG